ncbi:MAG: class I SAM-dependent RNA methyltransferase [Lachnospiraceae bacterium]|nr:class I SAM-dependent RNA methyltransferase [Lachnospiraceae bacterium]
MEKFEFICPCHFGMEAVLKKEILDLGYEIVSVEDGKITFSGDVTAFARANIFLRTAERVLWKVGSFKAETFEDLFQGTKAIAWEEILPKDAKFWVTKANSVKSKLFSPSDIQSIMKKAMVERMKQHYGLSRFEETGAAYPLRVSIMKDIVTVGIDTSGESLHKRGYRKMIVKAPIEETLAAALIMLTPWNKDRVLVDPFCGSGTIPIEAAMIGANIAPGMNREFQAEDWTNIIPKKCWYAAVEEANSKILTDVEMNIQGYDIDNEAIKAARQNAIDAGVDKYIHFQTRDVRELNNPKKYGFIITNPPYGERLEEKKDMPPLYEAIGQAYARLDSWSMFMITSFEDAVKYIGKQPDKNRKLYNGMLKTYFYSFMGPKPPKKPRNEQ